MERYAVIVDKVSNSNYGAYLPDLAGCVSTGDQVR